MGQDIGALGNLGALNQQQAQANLLANQQAAKTAAYEPYGRLQQYGSGLTGLAGGVASAYAEPAPVQSPLSQALSTALGVGGIYSRLYGKGSKNLMRPLKRPMFKTGGPIKEGVMNGLRDGGVATTMADATMMAGGGMDMIQVNMDQEKIILTTTLKK
jgi:hypothetical protein